MVVEGTWPHSISSRISIHGLTVASCPENRSFHNTLGNWFHSVQTYLLNREVTKQFNRTLGNTVCHSLLAVLISPVIQNPCSAQGIPKKLPPCEHLPLAAGSIFRNAPTPCQTSTVTSSRTCLKRESSLDFCSPDPLQVVCRVLPYETYNRGLVPTSQAWGPLGSMSFPLRLLHPQACF